MEEWKDIPGYEGEYQVSNMGRIKSLHDRYGNYRERLLKPIKNKGNYLRVNLFKNGKQKTCLIHRLVAMAFIPRIEGKDFVDHIDGDPGNNVYTNLRWCTIAENNNFDLHKKHQSEAQKGEKSYLYGKTGVLHHSSKKVLCVELNKVFESTMEAERELGINNSNISMCCNGKRYKSAGKHPVTGERLHWKYIDIKE